MYVGRIVSVACSKSGKMCGLYRVSSRSFPNREAKILDKAVAILPKAGHENDAKDYTHVFPPEKGFLYIMDYRA